MAIQNEMIFIAYCRPCNYAHLLRRSEDFNDKFHQHLCVYVDAETLVLFLSIMEWCYNRSSSRAHGRSSHLCLERRQMPLLSFRVISCNHKADRKPYADENERERKKQCKSGCTGSGKWKHTKGHLRRKIRLFNLLVTVETWVHRVPIKAFLWKTSRGRLPRSSYESCNRLSVTSMKWSQQIYDLISVQFTALGSGIGLMKPALGLIQ